MQRHASTAARLFEQLQLTWWRRRAGVGPSVERDDRVPAAAPVAARVLYGTDADRASREGEAVERAGEAERAAERPGLGNGGGRHGTRVRDGLFEGNELMMTSWR